MFSSEQDVETGRSVSAAAERQLPMLNDVRVDAYLNRLGPTRMFAACIRHLLECFLYPGVTSIHSQNREAIGARPCYRQLSLD